jgi:predicted Zn-dependent peptidase
MPALALGYRLPDPSTELDSYLAHALLGSVLTDGEAARLQQRLVYGEGIVTDISAGCGLFGSPLDSRDPDTFTVTAVHPADVGPDRVIAAVDEELDRLATDGPDSAELSRISARWASALYHEHDRVMSRTLALGSRELLYGRAELAAELPAKLALITPAQVAAAAGRLRGHGRAVLVVEPTASGTARSEEGA